MFSNLLIELQKKTDACFSYTDRVNSYLHFHCKNQELTDGLYCDNKQLLRNLYLLVIKQNSKKKYKSISDCKKIIYTPYFVNIYFEEGIIQLSLLIKKSIPTNDKPILFCKFISLTDSVKIIPVFSTVENNDILFYSENGDLQKKSSGNFVEYLGTNNSFYVCFQEIKNKKVFTNLFIEHEQIIDNYFSKCSITLPNSEKKISDSVLWAMFSGWLLVTGVEHRGIWAGLPWFRDNWGRDTFIALPGILLVSGQFEEAKKVIQSFSLFQDTNPESKTYGRIPNRYRNDKDVIYNTADGTFWFIREVWEYLQYTNDTEFLHTVWPIIKLAIDCDIKYRIDDNGFVLHGDADTWMDARIEGDDPWSPRGNKANDIQVLWITSLLVASKMAMLLNEVEYSDKLTSLLNKVTENFLSLFIDKKENVIVDSINSENEKNYQIRPNQFICFSIPLLLGSTINDFYLKSELLKIIRQNFSRLVFNYGVLSLDQDDENFHPYHDKSKYYHKDAAYHNGTIWLWNSGAVIDSLCLDNLQNTAYLLTKKHCEQMIDFTSKNFTSRCAGSLSENINAYQISRKIVPSGTWSQAWSVSEYSRNFFQSYLGIRPNLLTNELNFTPHFPKEWTEGNVIIKLGSYDCNLSWKKIKESSDYDEYDFTIKLDIKKCKINFYQYSNESLVVKNFYINDNGYVNFSGNVSKAQNISFAKPNNLNVFWKKNKSITINNYLETKILLQNKNHSQDK